MWLLIAALAVPLVLLLGLRRVREGEAACLSRFGRPAGTLSPGLHWLLPGEVIARRVSLLGRQFDLAPRLIEFGAHTARVGGRVYYQVLDAERALQAGDAIESHVLDALVTRLSGLLPQLVELSPAERNDCLKADLRATLRDEGILLTRLELAIRTNHIS